MKIYNLRENDEYLGEAPTTPFVRYEEAQAEINALKAELAALKAPPKVLSAEEVTEVGWYWARFGSSWDQIIEFYPPGGFEFPSHGKFIGPIQMPEV